ITVNTAGAAAGTSLDMKFELRKSEATHTGAVAGTVVDQSVASLARKVTIITEDEAKNLTYSLNTVGNLFNTRDDATYAATDATESDAATSKLAKELIVSAKDAAGNAVAVPKTITSVTSDVYTVAQVKEDGADPEATGYVIGNKVGTANVTVYFVAANGETKSVSGQVNVTNEANRVETIAAGSTTKTFTTAQANNENIFYLMNKVTVTNQYGNTFKSEGSTKDSSTKDVLAAYDNYLQVRYTITNVTDGLTVTLKADNTVSVTGTGSFVATAIAPNGKSVSTTVVVTATP
ncbi:hypothetical protein ABE504_33130, partial [Paenibacillus oryzisoli]